MKHIIIIFSIIAMSFNLQAQSSLISINESQLLLDGVMVNVASSQMTGDIKDIQKAWESYIKEQLDVKFQEKNGVLFIEETVINKITDKRGDVISYLFVFDSKVSFNFAYKLGYDVYVNSTDYPDEFAKEVDFINHFLAVYYDNFLPKRIKEVKKEQKNLLKELKKSNKIIKKTEKKNTKLDKLNSNPKEKTDVKLITEKIKVNSSVIESKKNFVTEIDPKIQSLKDEISTYEITLEEAKSKLKTY